MKTKNLSQLKLDLIIKALEDHKRIMPVNGTGGWYECFQVDHEINIVSLWFDTPDHNTHVVFKKLNQER